MAILCFEIISSKSFLIVSGLNKDGAVLFYLLCLWHV
jgi:hypothetical protein